MFRGIKMAFQRLVDSRGDWLKQSFLAPGTRLSMFEQRKQYYGDAKYKFVDTALGGNFYINTPPQFTRYCDLRVSGRYKSTSEDGKYTNNPDSASGMGAYYSEAIDDNALVVQLRFGVPEFNSLTSFFGSFYNTAESAFARTGRGPGFFYSVGNVFGTVLSLPFQPLFLAGDIYRYVAQIPATKFYYMKPTMPLYWTAATRMLTSLTVNMGIVPPVIFNKEQLQIWQESGDEAADYSTDPSNMQALSTMMSGLAPDIFREDGTINLYAVANRATRLGRQHQKQLHQVVDSANGEEDLKRKLDAYQNEMISLNPSNGIDGITKIYLDSVMGAWSSPSADKEEPDFEGHSRATAKVKDKEQGIVEKLTGWASKAGDYYDAERMDGSEFIGFRVNNFGTVSESFSSTTRQSDIQSKLNMSSQNMRNTRFSFAEGNFGDDPISNTIESVLGAAKDLTLGALDGMHIGGLAGLLTGAAFVDIPEQWENSTAQMPSVNFTINLRSPYGNKISRLQNLYVPLCMILAGALPKSTGTHSYTMPFLVQYFCKGRGMVRTGIIDSLSITRGVGNLGWTQEGEPLGIDITVSIKDLSTIMHMPIGGQWSINPLKGVLDEDTAYSDYLATLGGLGINDITYKWRRFRLALTRNLANWKINSFHNPAKFANWINGTLPGRAVRSITTEMDRPG